MDLGDDGAASGAGDMCRKQGVAGRWLKLAVRLLLTRDLVTCKHFVERALDVDPLVPGADELLVVADVLLASHNRADARNLNWYTILQLEDRATPPDLSAIRLAYRRLALLLQPDRNRHPGADLALRLVLDAWACLSDPEKKRVFDQELTTGTQPDAPGNCDLPEQGPSSQCLSETFWTMCPGCFVVHEYDWAHQGLTLRCQVCRKAFEAAALPSAPPVVPGTDKYFCFWRIHPIGYPGCPAFHIPEGARCVPMFPEPSQASAAAGTATPETGEKKGMGGSHCLSGDEKRGIPVATPGPLKPPSRKVLAHKPRNRVVPLPPTGLPPQVSQAALGPNAAHGSAGISDSDVEDNLGFDLDNISIDLDATATELGKISPL